MSRASLVARLSSKFTIDDDCWNWFGAMLPNGYGSIQRDRRQTGAHRAMFELLRGPIPDGMVIDHLCRNRRCVNPAHMEPVTSRVNVLRGEGHTARNAKKTHCVHGHPFDAENTYEVVVRGRVWRQCRACKARQKK